MRGRPLIAVIIAILALSLAIPVAAQQKPFTQEQVQGLVRDGMGDEMGARAIAQRGLDFTPTEDFLESLKAAGASEAFLNALRAAKPPAGEGNEAEKPLTQVQIHSLLSGDVPSHRVAILVKERGIDFDPNLLAITEIRLAGGDDELIDALKSATVKKPQNTTPALEARQAEVRQHTARGGQFMKNKQYDEAAAEYRAAIQLDPNNADLHNTLGWILGSKGDWDGEMVEEREAIRLNPNDERAHLNLGVALSNKDDQEGAMAEYREAIRLNPKDDQAHINLGNRLSHLNDWGGALAEYREAVRLNPNNTTAHEKVASVLEHDKDLDGAIAEYREAVRVSPNDEDAHLDLGVALSQKGDQDGAIAEYREVIRLNPKNEQAHVNLGNRLSYKQLWEGAAAEYGEALRLNPNNQAVHYSLGGVYEKQGNSQAALQEYRTAAQLDPKNDAYRKAVQRLSAQGGT